MAVGQKISGSRKLILFAYIYVVICGIFHPKTCTTTNVFTWQSFYVCIEVTKVKRFNNVVKRRRASKQRPLINALKLILGLRLILYVLYAVFFIKLSGDVELNPGPKDDAIRSVKGLVLNARSLTSSVKTDNKTESNLERFQNLVYSEDLDIVCVNETWLSGHIYSSEILNSGYCIVRKDRKTRGGGVLIGIKTAAFKSVREIEHNHDLEIAMAEITTAKDMELLICSCYRPPDADKTWIDKFESFLQDVCSRHSKIVIAGDFNFPRASWNMRENVSDVSESSFIKVLRGRLCKNGPVVFGSINRFCLFSVCEKDFMGD